MLSSILIIKKPGEFAIKSLEIKDLSVTINRDEGILKFKLTLKRAPAPEMNQVIALEKWRALFFKLGLIGEYPNEKISYGNMSSRTNKKSFIITGTQTGHLAHLQAHHYTKVIDCDLKKGLVSAEGLIPPSSEALIHFGIYEANPTIQYLFHVFNQDLCKNLKQGPFDSISEDISNGPQEIVEAANALLWKKSSGLFIMNGHEGGIVSYGMTVEETGKIILEHYRKLGTRQ